MFRNIDLGVGKMAKNKWALFLSDAIAIEETNTPGLVFENIRLVRESNLSPEKKKACIKKLRVLLTETNRHARTFSEKLATELKKNA
jgi:hypothetical protein